MGIRGLARGLRRAALAAVLSAAAVGPAAACLVCLPMPGRAPADALVEAEGVVLAREDPARPHRLLVRETLKGPTPASAPEVFLSPVDRRRLAADPDAVAVLVRAPGAEGWSRAAVGGADRSAFVRDVLARAPDWRRDPTDAARLDFFEPLLADPRDWLRDAALLEFARAPYPRIRAAAGRLPEATLRRGVEATLYLEWRPIYVLMLGARGGEAAAETVRAGYARALARGPEGELAAWAVALIEVDGPGGLARVAEDAAARPGPAMTALLGAISVQAGQGDPALRAPAVAAYAALLAARPEAAGHVAADLAAWEDWSLAPAVRRAVAGGRVSGMPALYAATLYVGMAKDRGAL